MAQWSIDDIEQKVRRLLGFSYDSSISPSDIYDEINRYYQYTFPVEVKPIELQSWWEPVITIGTDTYTMPQEYTAIIGPAYWDSDEIDISYSPTMFYRNFPQSVTYTNGKVTHGLIYNNQILLRKIPDDDTAGILKIGALLRPDELDTTDLTSSPLKQEWGLLLAFGAAEQMAYDFADDNRLRFILQGKLAALSQVEDLTKTQLSYSRTIARGY